MVVRRRTPQPSAEPWRHDGAHVRLDARAARLVRPIAERGAEATDDGAHATADASADQSANKSNGKPISTKKLNDALGRDDGPC